MDEHVEQVDQETPPVLAAKPSQPSQHQDFDDLVLPLIEALYTRAFFLERTRGEACDLVQDTLERALRSFHQFQAGTNVRRWLFRILHNLFVDRYRRRAREVRSTSIDDLDLPAPEPEPAPPWEHLRDEDITALLDGLARPFREVLELHFLSNLSYQDIGRSLHIPTATVGTRLLRARNKLRDLVAPARGDDDAGPVRVSPHLRTRLVSGRGPASAATTPRPAAAQRLRGRGMA
ncbi:MAG TPA: RNA polymerase sigma factor [Polyangia bacterium]